MINKYDIIILKNLEQKNKTSFLKGERISNLILVQQNVLKRNSVYKRIQILLKNKEIDKGAKDGRSNTYYITKKGLNLLKEISEGEKNEK